MKINKLLWVCLSLLLACGNKSGEEALNNYIIESGQVGPYKIGDPIPSTGQFDNFEIEASTETVAEEGETYEKPFNILSVENQEKIRFDFKYDSYTSAFVPLIREIIVTAPECKTAKGIGAGSTIEEFIKAYPDYTLWFTPLSDMFILETSELTVQFILKGEDFIGDNQNFDSDYNPL